MKKNCQQPATHDLAATENKKNLNNKTPDLLQKTIAQTLSNEPITNHVVQRQCIWYMSMKEMLTAVITKNGGIIYGLGRAEQRIL